MPPMYRATAISLGTWRLVGISKQHVLQKESPIQIQKVS